MEHLPEFIANHLFLVSLFVGILCLLLWNLFGTAASGIREIGPAEMIRMMNHEKAVILDIRDKVEFANGHILNAVNIPATKLAEQVNDLSKNKEKPLIFVCKQGIESVRAARAAKHKGLEKIYCLKGGLQAWKNANMPLMREQDTDNKS